jgi:hypothetical protein
MELKNLTTKSIEEAAEFAAQYGKKECLFWLGVLGRIAKAYENQKGKNQFEQTFLGREYIGGDIQKHWGRTMEKLKELEAFTPSTDMVVEKFMETCTMENLMSLANAPVENKMFHIMAGYTYFSGPSGWGRKREGAARPSTGRRRHGYYVTDKEDVEIRKLIENMRSGAGA